MRRCKEPVNLEQHSACARALEAWNGPPADLTSKGRIEFGRLIHVQDGDADDTLKELPEATMVPTTHSGREAAEVFKAPSLRAQDASSSPPALTIAMCGDFGPFSKRVMPTIHELLKLYPQVDVRWLASPPFPVGGSYLKDGAALAAHRQDRFEEVQALLFDLPENVSRAELLQALPSLKIDVALFEKHLDDPQTLQAVANQRAWCHQEHFQGSPAFKVGSTPVEGSRPLHEFVSKIDAQLPSAAKSE